MALARRSRAAENDLDEIAYYIAVEDGRPAVAERVVREIVDEADRVASLAHVSKLGSPAPELGFEIRLYPVKRWVLVFRYIHDGIEVLRIADSSQDYFEWKFE